MSLVELARYYTPVEADLNRMLLESHGITAVLFDAGLNSVEGGGLATAVRLMVLGEEFDEATAILLEDRST